jgi:hypothetical protein
VIDAYWRHAARSCAGRKTIRPDEDFWAWEAVDSVWTDGVAAAIEKLIELADAVPDPDLLVYLGGGPLEDLVSLWGDEFNDQIVDAAHRSANFLEALRNVYPTPNALVLWEHLGIQHSSSGTLK